MTSILYIASMNKTILPDAVRPGKHYSFLADLKLNAWAFVAVLASFIAHWLLPRHTDWRDPLRAAIALVPLVPSFLYVWSIARWIGGMDELQRRIQLEACLFGTTGTVFITAAMSLLEAAGVLQSHGLGWEGTFAAILLLYILGNIFSNRRYQ